MTFARYDVTHRKPSDILAYLDDLACVLMTTDHRHLNGFLRPVVPVVNVNVSAADGSLVDFDENFVSRNLGDRHVLEPQALLGALFDKGFHLGFRHASCYWWLYAQSAALDDFKSRNVVLTPKIRLTWKNRRSLPMLDL